MWVIKMSISINDLLKIENANIIDIRENYLYMLGHVRGSVNISGILLKCP